MKSLVKGKDRAEIGRRIEELSASDRALWGTMSVDEMLCHLRESFRMANGEQAAEPVQLPMPGWMAKWIALWAPMPWPKGLPTLPELRVGTVAMTPEGFAADRESLERAMSAFLEGVDDGRPHPMFGRMSGADWMRWGYLHTDHHLRQFGR